MSSPLLLPFLVLVLAICQDLTQGAQPLESTASEYLKAHNQARSAVGVGPLKWSEQLANVASSLVTYERDKMGCQFANLSNYKYGANQLLWSGRLAVTPLMVVDNWVQQKIYYNHTSNSCLPNHHCDVYTQVVWKKSLELGCAQASCVKQKASLTVCFYNPPGNIRGESPY